MGTYNLRIQKNITVGAKDPLKFLVTTDDGANFTDDTTNVTDGSGATHSGLDALDVLANGEYAILISSTDSVNGIYFDVGSNVNSNSSDLVVEFFNGTDYTAVSDLDDGTASGGATLAQDGYVSFAYPSGWAKTTIDGNTGYVLRISVSAQLSATVDVNEVKITGRTIIVDKDTYKISTITFLEFQNVSSTTAYFGDSNVVASASAGDNVGRRLKQDEIKDFIDDIPSINWYADVITSTGNESAIIHVMCG